MLKKMEIVMDKEIHCGECTFVNHKYCTLLMALKESGISTDTFIANYAGKGERSPQCPIKFELKED